MVVRVGVGLKSTAYTPEAYAYAKYLKGKGISVQLANEKDLNGNNDVNIFFMGVRPCWQPAPGKALEIHEYHSLSTGRLPKIKDMIKVNLNRKPVGRVFLNEVVRNKLNFSDEVPYIYRDMGVDKGFFNAIENNKYSYDIVYSGSISGRVGLLDKLESLSRIGFKLLVIGEVSMDIINRFKGNENIELVGRVERSLLPELYKSCRAGLNYTPDIYPFNIQTSTKVLEYYSSGLKVISNSYEWINSFVKKNNFKYVLLNEVNRFEDLSLDRVDFSEKMKEYSWERILDKSGLHELILKCI